MATKAIPSTTAPLTTEQAAAAIVKLINTRPDSPRQDEIEAIIARVAGGPALPPGRYLVQLAAPKQCLPAPDVSRLGAYCLGGN